MANRDEVPRTNPAEIEKLIEQIRGASLDPSAKDKIERLLRTVLTLVELLQRRNVSIKKWREMIFGGRTERHQGKKAAGQEMTGQSKPAQDEPPKASAGQDAGGEQNSAERREKPGRKGHGRRASSDYGGAQVVRCRHGQLKEGDRCPSPLCGRLYDLNVSFR